MTSTRWGGRCRTRATAATKHPLTRAYKGNSSKPYNKFQSSYNNYKPNKGYSGAPPKKGYKHQTKNSKVSNLVVQSNSWENFKAETIATGMEMSRNFKAGRVKTHLAFWQSITSDPVILTQIRGTQIDFEYMPFQAQYPEPYNFPKQKRECINHEINNMLQKGIIEKAEPCGGQFVSNIFAKDKSDGSLRIILDLLN